MGKYVMVVASHAKQGRDDEFNDWYDNVHVADVCKVPGVTSGRRFNASTPTPMQQPAPYLAFYEIETDEPAAVLDEIMRRSGTDDMVISDAIDIESTQVWMYEQR